MSYSSAGKCLFNPLILHHGTLTQVLELSFTKKDTSDVFSPASMQGTGGVLWEQLPLRRYLREKMWFRLDQLQLYRPRGKQKGGNINNSVAVEDQTTSLSSLDSSSH